MVSLSNHLTEIPFDKLKVTFYNSFSITKKQLLIYKPKNKRMGKAVRKMKLKNNESIVMIQWALGRNVDRWDRIIQKVK